MQFQFRIWHILVATFLVAIALILHHNWQYQSKLDTRIDQLNISWRAKNCLIFGGDIETVRELIQKSERELLPIRNLAQSNADEIREELKSMGLKLKQSKQTHDARF